MKNDKLEIKNNVKLSSFSYRQDVFSEDCLSHIFQVDLKQPDRIKKRESKWLEFKESFNWAAKAKYARTMAAFANTKGGYIVFGIANKPRILKGLMNDRFDGIDPAVISEFLNDTFSSELHWESYIHGFNGKRFGLIFVEESLDKPIISKRTVGDEIREGEIYYRYHGRSEKIKYPELKGILETQRRRELEMWFEHIKRIEHVGVRNAAVLDSVKGTIVGPGGSMFIDESLLGDISFLREGKFREKEGAPAIKSIGEAQILDSEKIQPIKKVYIPKIIRTPDIIHAFLKREDIDSPMNYIEQLSFETSGYLPIYFFIEQAKISISEAKEIISSSKSTSTSKRTLIKRLGSDKDMSLRTDTQSKAAIKRKEFREKVLQKRLDVNISPQEIKYALQAIRTLDKKDIDQNYVYPLIREWFDIYYADRNAKLTSDFRETLCYLDIIYYRHEAPEHGC